MIEVFRRGVNSFSLIFRPPLLQEFRFFQHHQWDSPEQITAIQQARLLALLKHAVKNVPYYREQFRRIGLNERSTNEDLLQAFYLLPLLDKTTVRNKFDALQSEDIGKRDCFKNWSGGSTGEPLAFIQERKEVAITTGITLRLFYSWHNIRPGDREIRLWGSERDLFYGRPPLKVRLLENIKGLKLINTFRMTQESIKDIIAAINEYKPVFIRGYSSSLFEIAQYAEQYGLKIKPPKLVISSAGTLYPVMREKMESVFGCPVYNHYGTREMHSIAMECPERTGLHINAFTHLIEVVDEQGKPCSPGEEGELVITALLNYVMPLIRYRIGDRGILSPTTCQCGRGLPMLKAITGRTVEAFRTRNGSVVLGEFFIYIFELILKGGIFGKVQVVQKDYDLIEIRAVLLEGRELTEEVKKVVTNKIKVAMGEDCQVEFKVVDDIPALASGKYSYTLCEIPEFKKYEG